MLPTGKVKPHGAGGGTAFVLQGKRGGGGDATHWKGETAWGGRRDRPRSAWEGEGGKGAAEGRGRLPAGEMRPQASHCSSGTYHTNPVHITL